MNLNYRLEAQAQRFGSKIKNTFIEATAMTDIQTVRNDTNITTI